MHHAQHTTVHSKLHTKTQIHLHTNKFYEYGAGDSTSYSCGGKIELRMKEKTKLVKNINDVMERVKKAFKGIVGRKYRKIKIYLHYHH